MPPTRQQLHALAAYRAGTARKRALEPKLPETSWTPVNPRRPSARRGGRLPTADEQDQDLDE